MNKVVEAIEILNQDINQFSGYRTNDYQLKGDIAEFWHGDTFNIRAAVNDSNLKATIYRSHDYTSPDI